MRRKRKVAILKLSQRRGVSVRTSIMIIVKCPLEQIVRKIIVGLSRCAGYSVSV